MVRKATRGVNTDFKEQRPSLKLTHDPMEESRLKENALFWKEKVNFVDFNWWIGGFVILREKGGFELIINIE